MTILSSDSKVALEDVTAMRFILRQPSPEWRSFGLEDISVFRESLVGSTQGNNYYGIGVRLGWAIMPFGAESILIVGGH